MREKPTLLVSEADRDAIYSFKARERERYVVRFALSQSYGAPHVMVRVFDFKADGLSFVALVSRAGGFVNDGDPVAMTPDQAEEEFEIAAGCID